MTQHLPTKFDASQLPTFSGEFEDSRPILFVDQGTGDGTPGTFNYSGTALKEIDVIFVAGRETRRLYAASYTVDPKAPLVCASWDGENAWGTARVGYDTSDLKDQSCKGCPLAKAFICKPNYNFMVLIRGTCVDGSLLKKWVPAIMNIRGICATPTKKAFRSLRSRATGQVLKDANGNEAPAPIWLYRQTAKLYKPDKMRQGYTIEWGPSSVIDEDDMQEVYEWVQAHATALWDEDLSSTEAQCRAIGMDEDGERPEGSGPTKDDPIPF